MRATHFTLPALLLLAGCPKKQVITDVTEQADPYPALVCPDGTEKKGAAPPVGFKVWCMRMQPNGQWINDGGMVQFYETGEKKSEGAYLDNQKSGTWLSFYESGQKMTEELWMENKANGTWLEFHSNGQKKAEGEKVEGHEIGAWLYWHDNGNKFKEGIWKDGEPDGMWIEYDDDGTPSRERLYKFGRLLTHKEL